MSATWTDSGLGAALQAMLNFSADQPPFYLQLYVNDPTLSESMLDSDFAFIDSGIYSPVDVLSDPDEPFTTGHVAFQTTSPLQLIFTDWEGSEASIYGYAITTATDSGVVCAERFDTPLPVADTTGVLNLTISFSLRKHA